MSLTSKHLEECFIALIAALEGINATLQEIYGAIDNVNSRDILSRIEYEIKKIGLGLKEANINANNRNDRSS